MPLTRRLSTLSLILVFALAACGGDDATPPDPGNADGGETDAGADRGTGDAANEVGDRDVPAGESRWTKPSGAASLVFRVDDRANQTYQDGEMEWNASLTYDVVTNMVTSSASWLPEEGPYPPLYDDGPYTEGGHEASDAVAGDHIFTLEVFYEATEDTTFEYGLINDLDHWIWQGANGLVTVTAGETGRIEAQGFAFAAFGDIDLRVTLDTGALHDEFTFDPDEDSLFLKGSMISWKPVQLLDNGERGDAAADDGIYTFTLAEYLGPHDGKLAMGQEAQFVFVFFEADGLEYKLTGNALVNGVTAYSDWETRGTFAEEELLLRTESRGRALNTAVLVGPDEPIVVEGDPVLRFVDPDRGPASGGTPVEIKGEHFANGATVTFGDNTADCSVQSETIITCTTPVAAAPGTVAVTVENPDGASDIHELGFTYVDSASAPSISSVDPVEGSEAGGTTVTISGTNFVDGATVLFDNELASDVTWSSASSMSAKTPAHAPGPVAVAVRNPDGQIGQRDNAFTYRIEGVDFATIQSPTSTVTGSADGPLPTLYGRVYEPGVTEPTGQGGGVCGQIIWAAHDAGDPTDDDTGWTPATMSYQGDIGNDDEYKATITIDTEGDYIWAVRFTLAGSCDGLDGSANWTYGDMDGSANGFSLDQVGQITVKDGILVTDLVPAAIPPVGATDITVSGFDLGSDLTVEVRVPGGDYATQAYSGATANELTLDFADSDRVIGSYDLRLTRSDDVLEIENAFIVGYVGSPTIDGTIQISSDDWDTLFRLGEDTRESNWGANALEELYVAFDERGLYVAFTGSLQRTGTDDPGNAVVLYLDTDFGGNTGFKGMNAIGDNDPIESNPEACAECWRADRALTSALDASGVAGFGADYALATFEFAPPDFEDRNEWWDPMTGWRELVGGNNGWIMFETGDECTYRSSCGEEARVACAEGTAPGESSPGVFETFIPWCAIFGDAGLPVGGRQMAIFVRVVNKDGQFTSNQSLPMEPAFDEDNATAVTNVVVFDVQ